MPQKTRVHVQSGKFHRVAAAGSCILSFMRCMAYASPQALHYFIRLVTLAPGTIFPYVADFESTVSNDPTADGQLTAVHV